MLAQWADLAIVGGIVVTEIVTVVCNEFASYAWQTRCFRGLIQLVVVLAGTTNSTGQGFGTLSYLVVVGIVLAGAAGFASG